MISYSFIKSVLDRLTALVLVLLFLPLAIVIAVLLSINLRGNPFFTQLRPGLNETPFSLLKFRTMTECKDARGQLLPDVDRLTKVGAFIRKTSLDELPQLINILKGDMSFVGPRPLLMEYLPLYTKEQMRRHQVKPGITGLAQVNGRNAIRWQEKFKFDVFYVDNVSLQLDMKIILLTLKKVLKAEGVNASETVTMKKFDGTN